MTVTVFGGDERSVAAAHYFASSGYETSVYALGEDTEPHGVKKCLNPYLSDVIVFPLPFCGKDGYINCPLSQEKYKVTDVFSGIRRETMVFAGCASAFAVAAAKEYSIDLFDYYECEDLQIKNSIPTAEGALFEFMKRKKKTVFASECAVTGYGKIGRRVSDRLKALGAKVTVAARGERDLASAFANGMNAERLDDFLSRSYEGDCIFNTVPCCIFDEAFAGKVGKDTLYIELASKPYGMTEKCRELLGDSHVFANSLPGKYAPLSAGKIIAETVCKYITSRRSI